MYTKKRFNWVVLLQNTEGPVAKRLRWIAVRALEWYAIEQSLLVGRWVRDQVDVKGN